METIGYWKGFAREAGTRFRSYSGSVHSGNENVQWSVIDTPGHLSAMIKVIINPVESSIPRKARFHGASGMCMIHWS